MCEYLLIKAVSPHVNSLIINLKLYLQSQIEDKHVYLSQLDGYVGLHIHPTPPECLLVCFTILCDVNMLVPPHTRARNDRMCEKTQEA